MFWHKDIKMIVLHELRRRAPTLLRLLSVYIICIPFCSSALSEDWIMIGYKAISVIGRARVKAIGEHTS